MAGAHRDVVDGERVKDSDAADVADLEHSVFQTVHKAWNDPGGSTTSWSIHGFGIDLSGDTQNTNRNDFPPNTGVVLSNGDPSILSPEVIALDHRFEAAPQLASSGLVSHAFADEHDLRPFDGAAVNEGGRLVTGSREEKKPEP